MFKISKKKKKIAISTILMFSIIFFTFSNTKILKVHTEADKPKNSNFAYISHDPIKINSDDDFVSLGFPGSGTKNDPYIIENYWIEDEYEIAIEICCTTSYFVIRNCLLENSYSGIYLSFIAPNSAIVTDNFLNRNEYGVYVLDSSSCEIHQNIIYKSENYGVNIDSFFSSSDNNTIYRNIFVGNNHGNCQGYENGTDNKWHNSSTLVGNYWDDYSGMGDYSIDGPAGNADLYPLIDTDEDELPLEWELEYYLDPWIDDSADDPDNDNLTNLEEFNLQTNPTNDDTDTDGLSDGDEINEYETDPTKKDSDSDGMDDGYEVDNSLDPLTNDSFEDPDADTLTNLEEFNIGSNPQSEDTDSDGMNDGWEYHNSLDPINNDSSEDPDDDGLSNLGEYIANTDPLNPDSDEDGFLDGEEVNRGSDPLDPESFPISAEIGLIIAIASASVVLLSLIGVLVYFIKKKGLLAKI